MRKPEDAGDVIEEEVVLDRRRFRRCDERASFLSITKCEVSPSPTTLLCERQWGSARPFRFSLTDCST
jgi:hypothetical protein